MVFPCSGRLVPGFQSPAATDSKPQSEQSPQGASREAGGDQAPHSGPMGGQQGGEGREGAGEQGEGRERERSARQSLFLPPPERVVARDSTGRQAKTEEMDREMQTRKEKVEGEGPDVKDLLR